MGSTGPESLARDQQLLFKNFKEVKFFFTKLAWSLAFLGDKPNSILRFSLKRNLISLWNVFAHAREVSGNETHISREFSLQPVEVLAGEKRGRQRLEPTCQRRLSSGSWN